MRHVKLHKLHPKEYNSWRGIKHRCLGTNNISYPNYGGRGIKICARWRHSFANFLADMGEKPTPKHSIDRIDNDGDYTPENCCWSDRREQSSNKRNNRLVKFNGKTQTLVEWARELGISYQTLHTRVKELDWDIDKAFKQPSAGRAEIKTLVHNGTRLTVPEAARRVGISRKLVNQRLRNGWPEHLVLTPPEHTHHNLRKGV